MDPIDVLFCYRFFINNYEIVDKKTNKIIDDENKFKILNDISSLSKIKDKINKKYSGSINYVFEKSNNIVLECSYISIDNEFKEFLREELGLIIVTSYINGYYQYIECKKAE